MSRVTRRKHVLKEMMEDNYELPKENQKIVRIVCSRGNNLHEVETSIVDDDHFLVTMPTKFRKNVYVKRGDYILVDPIEEGHKVRGEICKILTPDYIKEYKKANIWPENFPIKSNSYNEQDVNKQNNKHDDNGFDDLEPNMNRTMLLNCISEDSDDSDTYSSSEDENLEDCV